MSESIVYIGVDVSKDTLDFSCGKFQRGAVPHTAKDRLKTFQAIAKEHPKGSVFHLVCEASGGYEQALIESAMEFGWRVSRVSPSRVRAAAKALGIHAKTDKIDARLIETFASKVLPAPLSPQDASLAELRELVSIRKECVDRITRAKNRLSQQSRKSLQKIYQQTIALAQKQMADIDKAIAKLTDHDDHLDTKIKRLTQVQGVGAQTAHSVLAFMPELGTLNDTQVASLAGLAPFNQDSGTLKGQRCIRSGRSELRTALYMPALTASRSNPVLSKFYQSLIQKGKKPKVALVAVMRKLIVLLNRILKNPDFVLAT